MIVITWLIACSCARYHLLAREKSAVKHVLTLLPMGNMEGKVAALTPLLGQ